MTPSHIVHIKINAVLVTPLQMFSVSLCQMLHTRLILANGTEPMEQITHTIVKIMGKNGGQNKDKNKNVHNLASVWTVYPSQFFPWTHLLPSALVWGKSTCSEVMFMYICRYICHTLIAGAGGHMRYTVQPHVIYRHCASGIWLCSIGTSPQCEVLLIQCNGGRSCPCSIGPQC